MLAMLNILCFLTTVLYMDIMQCNLLEKNSEIWSWNACRINQSELTCSFIPSDVPDGIKSVRLINIDGTETLKNGTFTSYKWGQVKTLEISADKSWESNHDSIRLFDSFCFSGLKNLRKLQISLRSQFVFTPQTLSGLSTLTRLDFSGCIRFSLENLIDGLADPGIVPSLEALNISHLYTYRKGVKLTDKFFKAVSGKGIKEVDMSSIQILFLNLTSLIENCETLEYLNLSRVMISNYVYSAISRSCPKLKYLDASDVILPTSVIPNRGPQIVSNMFIHYNLSLSALEWMFNIDYINLSGVIPRDTTLILYNTKVLVTGLNNFSIKNFILSNNNFERLDVTITMSKATFESLDLSHCKLRFLNPDAISSFVLLKRLDFSNNKLNEMIAENVDVFGKLFRNLTQLRYINLSGNKLTTIPFSMFKSNSKLEIINLSNNLLSQVTFEVNNLGNLKIIDLTRNMIQVLNSDSRSRLNFLIMARIGTGNNTVALSLLLKDNPVSCSKCDSLSSIKWLVQSKFAIIDYVEVKCESKHSERYLYIDQNAVDTVKRICNRPKVIAAVGIGSAAAIIVVAIILLLIRRHQKQKRYKRQMEDRCALIRQGADSREFVVFLSFSSKDDDFVYNNVLQPLNKHLQNMLGNSRDLVCEGDRNFRLGKPIHDQISELLKRSSVVVVVLSDNYSLSVHCRNEFDQAITLEKPIVLMIKDEVDTECMPPLIRDIYDKRTRVTWKRENGQHVLKTSWDNVCRSIIELVHTS